MTWLNYVSASPYAASCLINILSVLEQVGADVTLTSSRSDDAAIDVMRDFSESAYSHSSYVPCLRSV